MKDNTPLKNYWFWIFVIIVVPVMVFYLRFDLPASQATLLINFDGDVIRKFEGSTDSKTTVLSALYSASLGGGFEVKYTLEADGSVTLYKIGGLRDLKNIKSWHFYLNGRAISTTAINQTLVKEDDIIEVKYEE